MKKSNIILIILKILIVNKLLFLGLILDTDFIRAKNNALLNKFN